MSVDPCHTQVHYTAAYSAAPQVPTVTVHACSSRVQLKLVTHPVLACCKAITVHPYHGEPRTAGLHGYS